MDNLKGVRDQVRYIKFLSDIQNHGVLVEIEKGKEYKVLFKGQNTWAGPINLAPIYRTLTRKERRKGVDLSQYIKP
jgi:hypothetical protein